MKHATLAKIIPRSIEFFNQRVFRNTNLLVQCLFPLPVRGTERRRSLEHQVLKKVRCPELARRFVECAHIGKYLADHPLLTGPFDDEQPQPVLKNVFPRGGRRPELTGVLLFALFFQVCDQRTLLLFGSLYRFGVGGRRLSESCTRIPGKGSDTFDVYKSVSGPFILVTLYEFDYKGTIMVGRTQVRITTTWCSRIVAASIRGFSSNNQGIRAAVVPFEYVHCTGLIIRD